MAVLCIVRVMYHRKCRAPEIVEATVGKESEVRILSVDRPIGFGDLAIRLPAEC